MKQTRLTMILLAGLLLLCSCHNSDQDPIANQDFALPACLADGSCQLDQCGSEACQRIANTLVHVEIEPSSRSGYVGQQQINVPLGQIFGKGLELKPVVYFYGTLVRSKIAGTPTAPTTIRDIPDMSSDIVAIPVSRNGPQGKASIVLANQSVQSTSVNASGFFNLGLVAGQDYRLIANPSGSGNQPPIFLDINIDTDHVGDIALPLSGRKVTGRIAQDTLSPETLSDKLWIRVVQDKRQISSVGHLNSDGHFSVVLANSPFDKDLEAHPVYLSIEPTSDAAYLATIRMKLDLGDNDEDINVGTLNIGPSRPLIRSHFVIVSAENSAPVKDARVIIRAVTQTGYLQSATISDANGLAEFIVPEGEYDVAVIPQYDSLSSFKKLHDVKLENSAPIQIRLDSRSELRSHIVDESNSAIAGARIVLTRFARADSDAREAIFNDTELRLEAKSNADGQWCILGALVKPQDCNPIHLDSGRYRLSVTPPEGSTLPYFTQVIDFPQSSEIPIVLKKAISLKGRILAPKAEIPVANSFIRIYAAQTEKESGEPIFLTQAFTRSDGTFSVVLPQEYVLDQTP